MSVIRSIGVTDEELLFAFARGHFLTFAQLSFHELWPGSKFLYNWHLEVMADYLERWYRGEILRLIMNQPPRSGKSLFVSVALRAWMLGLNPSEEIIAASYSQDLANKHALDCRRVMSSAWYRKMFPHTRLSKEKQAVNDFMTTRGGGCLSTSVGGTLTGRGANFGIIDDPTKPEEALSDVTRAHTNDWYGHTYLPRMNDKKTARLLVVMQRQHMDDLTGYLTAEKDHGWHLLRLPAIAEEDESFTVQTPGGIRVFGRKAGEALHEEREPLWVLEGLRKSQGLYHFSSQYLQSPVPYGGGLIKDVWLQRYKQHPPRFGYIFQSWDTAAKTSELNDYSACLTFGVENRKLYLIDAFHARLDFPALLAEVKRRRDMFQPRYILIEEKSSGISLLQQLKRDGVWQVQSYLPKMDKVMRMHSFSSFIENGLLLFPESAPWLEEYLRELLQFPMGKYDDFVDATSQALDWYDKVSRGAGVSVYNFLTGERIV